MAVFSVQGVLDTKHCPWAHWKVGTEGLTSSIAADVGQQQRRRSCRRVLLVGASAHALFMCSSAPAHPINQVFAYQHNMHWCSLLAACRSFFERTTQQPRKRRRAQLQQQPEQMQKQQLRQQAA
jgi:hypothetical protein